MSLAFFDTNVLVYVEDASVPHKQRRAADLFDQHLSHATAVLSLQVLQEYYATVTTKLLVEPRLAQRKIELFSFANVVRFETKDIIAAIELHRLSRTSFWDALIIHAARISGATELYSEDFQHGSVLAGVRVVNPFAP